MKKKSLQWVGGGAGGVFRMGRLGYSKHNFFFSA